MKQVIHIFGAAGSGTTTLGEKICDELGYKMMDTDDYYWLPTEPRFTQKRSVDERLRLMLADIEKYDKIVISGSLTDWGDVLIPYFTLAIRIEVDTETRVARIKAREQKRFGSRIAPGGDMYQGHIEFLEWTRRYDEGGLDMRSKAKHDEWQKLLPCEILQLDGKESIEAKLEKVKDALDNQRNQG